jgi:protein-arginine deiminase
MRTMKIPSALFLAALAAAGCGDANSDTGSSSGGTTTTTDPPEPAVVVSFATDANRDGKVDPADPADHDSSNEWNSDHGAAFLANLDDDDLDKVRDVDDTILNGPDDEADLAPIIVAAWADAPDGATGVFHLDPLSAENVRLWKKGLDGVWVLAGGSVGPCNTKDPTCQLVPDVTFTLDEVRAGLTLGLEGRTFRRSLADGAWSGTVQLGYQVNDDKGVAITSEEVPTGVFQAKMRVAPWIMFGNLSPFQRVLSANFMPKFVTGLTAFTAAAGVEYKKITNWDDQWTQDYFQTAWTSIPRADGTVQGMRVANARPWGQCDAEACLPYKWLTKAYLGPDAGILEIYKTPNSGSTYDSHGNHDLLPPYETADAKFPLGRIIHGSNILPETHAFYAAQEVQGPPLQIKTSWLYVGHVDEVFSYVPAMTPRGWKLLVGSPKLAREMLESAQAAGNGALTMFKGKKWLPESGGTVPAEISIDAVLADQDLMAASQDAQGEIDDLVDQMKAEVGLTDDEMILIPYLMEEVFGQKLAYNPGTANILVVGDYAAIPDPWGPVIDGADMFQKDLLDRLATPLNKLGSNGEGLHVTFVDDWEYYHSLDGEVHCGSNVDAAPPAAAQWWKVMK